MLTQVLFLLYHYFQTYQLYNAIRVFIAAYVWMTGFGNFAYYYKTNDFHLPRCGHLLSPTAINTKNNNKKISTRAADRFCGMMWRLNFLVTITCLVLRNSYMLYYICPMHTLFTLMVYGALAIAKDHNKKDWVIWTKYGYTNVLDTIVLMGRLHGFFNLFVDVFNTYGCITMHRLAASVAVVYICWEIKPVFYALWSPWTWLLGYQNPRQPSNDLLHGANWCGMPKMLLCMIGV